MRTNDKTTGPVVQGFYAMIYTATPHARRVGSTTAICGARFRTDGLAPNPDPNAGPPIILSRAGCWVGCARCGKVIDFAAACSRAACTVVSAVRFPR